MAEVGLIINIVGGFFIVVVAIEIGLAVVRDQITTKATPSRVAREEVRILFPTRKR